MRMHDLAVVCGRPSLISVRGHSHWVSGDMMIDGVGLTVRPLSLLRPEGGKTAGQGLCGSWPRTS
ncbi:hypothetical protein GCM10010358_82980 [Streptomyces minutiscleroticus]|uniref:Uncharacterized protein n=1 Tax=Streptomyces minutiscleroticus TaxID=68238 RepID=A0A918UAY9_9ACTN|nr:hypothetical protein GCM10010358_82980 [Streptomyces minutiscleroticus]